MVKALLATVETHQDDFSHADYTRLLRTRLSAQIPCSAGKKQGISEILIRLRRLEVRNPLQPRGFLNVVGSAGGDGAGNSNSLLRQLSREI